MLLGSLPFFVLPFFGGPQALNQNGIILGLTADISAAYVVISVCSGIYIS